MQAKQKTQQVDLCQLIDFDPQRKIASLPLEFELTPLEILSKEFTKLNNNHHYRIHYLGPRPHNTLTLHKKYAYTEKSPHQQAALAQNIDLERYRIDSRRIVQSHLVQQKLRGNCFYRSGLFYRAFEGMNPYLGEEQWVFNSLFESGNLDCAIKIQQCEFDLFLRVDSNTKGHVQWFYFSVKNGTRKQHLKLNLCNLSKGKTLYDAGLQPYVFSRHRNRLNGTTWTQSGVNLGITKKQLRYDFLEDKVPSHLLEYYCLELQYDFQYENDEVFFAYCIPFTYSRLLREIAALPSQWIKQGVLGRTLSGIDIPLLHITNHELSKQKKNILITGRWHPGQSNSSHMLQGFMAFLTSTSRQATELRNRANFFIVPMANPDGVVVGNSRTSLAGKDLNRQFLLANRQLYPEVAYVKDLARKLQSLYGLFMYFDFHGHSRKKNTFFYGPTYSIHQPNYYKCRILPKLVEKVDSNFRFHSCSFTINEEKKHTARAVMFQHLKVPFSFTIETSIGYFYNGESMKTEQLNQHEWRTIGTSIAQGLSKFIVGFEEYEELLRERRQSRQRQRPRPPTAGKPTFKQQQPDQEQIANDFKRGDPLKIVYNQKSLFGSMIEQLKTTKFNNYIKQIDQQCESDTHDEAEEFEASKMKQFNSLLSDAAKRDPLNKPKKQTKPNSVKSHRDSSRFAEEQELQEELRFLSELNTTKKILASPIQREKPKSPSKLAKGSHESRKYYQGNRMTALSQLHSRTLQASQIEKHLERRSFFDKKLMCDDQNEISGQKISYFGQFRIFVDKDSEEKTKVFQRTSLFHREKVKRHCLPQQSNFMSESLLQRAKKHTFVQSNSITANPPKPAHFEFKFDQIETAVLAKERLQDYLRTKINKATRNNAIGPASFYGVRQNINQKKISNKQKFIERQQSPRKHSFKIIKLS